MNPSFSRHPETLSFESGLRDCKVTVPFGADEETELFDEAFVDPPLLFRL